MNRLKLLNEEVVDVIYKYAMGEALAVREQEILNKWLSVSSYNRSVLDDIHSDYKLRERLLGAYSSDRSQFWYVIISYRLAMNPDMPPRAGNFWQRAVKTITGFFRKKPA